MTVLSGGERWIVSLITINFTLRVYLHSCDLRSILLLSHLLLIAQGVHFTMAYNQGWLLPRILYYLGTFST